MSTESPTDFLDDAQIIEVSGVKLELIVKGTGAPLLFLHGMDGVEACARLIECLAKDFTVYAPSHPGFGVSELPRAFSSVDDLAYFYLDLLDQLDLKDVAIAGFSLGGWIAAEILVKDDQRANSLILGAPFGLRTAEGRESHVTDLFMLNPKELDAWLQVTPATDGQDLSGLPEAKLERIARNAEAVSLFGWSPYLYNPKLHLRLHRIKVPTLLLWGEEDRLAPLDYGRKYAAAMAHAELETLSACGHRIYRDRPEAAAASILKFVPA